MSGPTDRLDSKALCSVIMPVKNSVDVSWRHDCCMFFAQYKEYLFFTLIPRVVLTAGADITELISLETDEAMHLISSIIFCCSVGHII